VLYYVLLNVSTISDEYKKVVPENAEDNDGRNENADAEEVKNRRRVDTFQIRL